MVMDVITGKKHPTLLAKCFHKPAVFDSYEHTIKHGMSVDMIFATHILPTCLPQ
jgi:hypothetical protein